MVLEAGTCLNHQNAIAALGQTQGSHGSTETGANHHNVVVFHPVLPSWAEPKLWVAKWSSWQALLRYPALTVALAGAEKVEEWLGVE